jgi:hypothetical protein
MLERVSLRSLRNPVDNFSELFALFSDDCSALSLALSALLSADRETPTPPKPTVDSRTADEKLRLLHLTPTPPACVRKRTEGPIEWA